MMCLVIMQGVQGGKISEQESFLTRVKRASCDPQGAEQCALEATQTYMGLIFDENNKPKPVPAGEKPDYQERKTCNFLLDTEKCFEKLESCGIPADHLKGLKDAAFKQARDAANKLPNWNDEKCQSADPNPPKKSKAIQSRTQEGGRRRREGGRKRYKHSRCWCLFCCFLVLGSCPCRICFQSIKQPSCCTNMKQQTDQKYK